MKRLGIILMWVLLCSLDQFRMERTPLSELPLDGTGHPYDKPSGSRVS